MTKRRTTKKSIKSKSRKPFRKAKAPPVVVHRVALPAAGMVRVVTPPGAVPLVATDPVTREVVIVAARKKKSFWESLFG